MPRHPLEDLLRTILKGGQVETVSLEELLGGEKKENLPSPKEQRARLAKFLAAVRESENLTEGEAVELTAEGRRRYRFPVEGQEAVVTRVFANPVLDEKRNITTGEIAVVNSCEDHNHHICTYRVDLSFFKSKGE